MKKIVIVSDDYCGVKLIINTISKIKKNYSIEIKNTSDFINQKNYKINKILYIIDMNSIETNILLKLEDIKYINNIIIVINMNKTLKSLLVSNQYIDYYLERNYYIEKELNKILLSIFNDDKTNIDISKKNIPVVLNKYSIDHAYNFSNNQVSISYNNGNNNIILLNDKVSDKIKRITKDSFYTDGINFKNNKKKLFTNPIKQLVVDLYLIFNIDCDIISKHFKIDVKYIKKWASLSKYNRKINTIGYLIGKLVIKFYLENEEKK